MEREEGGAGGPTVTPPTHRSGGRTVFLYPRVRGGIAAAPLGVSPGKEEMKKVL